MIHRMYWACAEVLALAAQLPAAKDLPPPDMLQRRVGALLGEMDRRAIEASVPAQDALDAKYAIVALIDELLVRASWSGRQEWMLDPLQLRYFNENTAGEGFFARLEAAERDASRLHVVAVYSICLALGFQGKYAVRAGEGLSVVVERLGARLDKLLPPIHALSPRGLATDRASARVRRNAPVLALSFGLVIASILAFVACKAYLASASATVTMAIERDAHLSRTGSPPLLDMPARGAQTK